MEEEAFMVEEIAARAKPDALDIPGLRCVGGTCPRPVRRQYV